MPRRKLSPFNQGKAIALLDNGFSMRQVSQQLGVSKSVVHRIQRRHQQTGSTAERPRSGRPRQTCEREDRLIERQAVTERPATLSKIRQNLRQATHTNVSVSTVSRRLHEVGLHSRRPVRRHRLTQAQRTARQAWCRHHERWTRADWGHVLFTDESRFKFDGHDGRVRVWRRSGELFLDDCISESTAYGGGSVMV